MSPRWLNLTASASLIALIFLCIAWELWLAPLRPGGSWLALKALPLLVPLFGILRGRCSTHQWTSVLALAYLVEGAVRWHTDDGDSAALAAAETFLSLALYLCAAFYARATASHRA